MNLDRRKIAGGGHASGFQARIPAPGGWGGCQGKPRREGGRAVPRPYLGGRGFLTWAVALILAVGTGSCSSAPPSDFEALLALARQGNVNAQFDVGLQYYDGKGTARDETQAAHWFGEAANQGHPKAQYNLGVMALKGEGLARDPAHAESRFNQAAEQGNSLAQYNLAWMYHTGQGRGRNLEQAAHWYRRSAEQGLIRAQLALGWMFQQGQGVSREEAEAARWYRRAAEQGDAQAAFNLGLLHLQGTAFPRSDSEAFKWIHRSAEQGHPKALYQLGGLFFAGRGIAQNFLKAHIYYALAAQHLKGEESERAKAKHQAIAQFLTPLQLAESHETVKAWRPTSNQNQE